MTGSELREKIHLAFRDISHKLDLSIWDESTYLRIEKEAKRKTPSNAEKANKPDNMAIFYFLGIRYFAVKILKKSMVIEVHKKIAKDILVSYDCLPTTNSEYHKIGIASVDEIFSVISSDKLLEHAFNNSSSERFGCCSKYLICSDELKCVNTEVELAVGCNYHNELRTGKVFYGKNRNI